MKLKLFYTKKPLNFKGIIFKVFKITIKRTKHHDEKKYDLLNCLCKHKLIRSVPYLYVYFILQHRIYQYFFKDIKHKYIFDSDLVWSMQLMNKG